MRLKIRVETWQKNGNHMGWKSEEAEYETLEDAIQRARELYVDYNSFVLDIQITISEKNKRIWKYLNGKSGKLDDRERFIDE